jgi:spermidine synthase
MPPSSIFRCSEQAPGDEQGVETMHRQRVLGLLALFFVSGFAGLGHEMVWTRMLGLGLGHEMAAVLAVLASFFCGVALGAWLLDRRAGRSRQAQRLFAILELWIGLWALALIWLIPWANATLLPTLGFPEHPLLHWLTAFGYTFVLLLPATFAMGATLPAMETLVSTLRRDAHSLGSIYGANTLGAMAGTLATIFVLLPWLGSSSTLVLLACLNFLAAFGVLALTRPRGAREGEPQLVQRPCLERAETRRLGALLFWTGLLGIGFEVLAVRVLSQVLQNTVYSFAMLLAVYLLGTAIGAALYQRLVRERAKTSELFERSSQRLLVALSSACLLGALLLRAASGIHDAILATLGSGFGPAILSEFAVAALVFLPPTLLMGMLFTHLAERARGERGGLGHALGINTVGAAAAPLFFGVLLLPALGSRWTFVLLASAYLLPLLLRPRLSRALVVPAGLAAALALLPFETELLELPEDARIVLHDEGIAATVTVLERESGQTVLKINNQFQMGGTASIFADRRQGHIPLLLHPQPKNALFLGLGTGATFAAAAEHPELQATAVELLPEVTGVLEHFGASGKTALEHPRLEIVHADARRFIQRSSQRYDVVIADLFHPARDGAGSLYTCEHFAAVRSVLSEGGVFCQWLPLYQMELDTLRLIARSFASVFPSASIWLTHYNLDTPIVGLVAAPKGLKFAVDHFERRCEHPLLREALRRYRLEDALSLFGCYVAGSEALGQFARSGPLNTDDRPLVIYRAPRFVYSEQGPASARLLELLAQLDGRPEHLLAEGNEALAQRLERYWRARNRFLEVGTRMDSSLGGRRLLAQIRGPLLEILRISPDFEAAYLPLLGLALQQYRHEPTQAIRLLTELVQLSPTRPEARRALAQIGR